MLIVSIVTGICSLRGGRADGTSPCWLEEPSLLHVLRSNDRERRLLLLLLFVWTVNMFDLGFTLLAHEQRLLVELNPLARGLFAYGSGAVMVYKLSLLVFGSLVLWRFRRHPSAEAAAWVVAGSCVLLALLWHSLYQDAEPFWVEVNIASEILPGPLIAPP
jgi:hypothetical protein